jgi:MFS family permease
MRRWAEGLGVTDVTERDRLYWTTAIFAFIGVTAVGFQMRGALLPSLQESFAVSQSWLGLVGTAGTVGFVCTVLVTGMAAGRIDIDRVTDLSAVVVGCSMVAMAFAPAFGVYLATLLVRGIATGPFRALDRAILSHLYPGGRGRIFNLYALVWALGAAAGPLVVTGALVLGNWRFAYLALALGFFPVVVLLWRLELPDAVSAEQPLTRDNLRTLLGRPTIAGMGGALILSGGVEGSLFTWLPYFAARFFEPGTANLLLTVYLLGYVPGRLFYGYLVDRLSLAIDLVLVLAICLVPVYYLAIFQVRGLPLFAAVGVLGFGISGLFPTLSAIGVNTAPQYSGPVNAIATSTSYCGIAIFSPLVGILAGEVGLERALALPLVLLCLFAVVVAVTRRSVVRQTAAVSGVE